MCALLSSVVDKEDERIHYERACETMGIELDRHHINKSKTGHMLGAAGGAEAIISLKALQEGILPPTINLDHPDPACDLDFVPHQSRKKEIQAVMSNTFGFGGVNAVLIFKKLNG